MKKAFNKSLSWLLSVAMIFGMLVVSNVSLTANAYSYNASAAVDYARQYWNNYNPAYKNYNSVGGDCANFVSQCLYAGGLEQDDRWYNGSTAWINCSSQIAYFRDMGFTVIDYAQASDIKIGNPVYYYNGNSMSHTAICVGYSSDGTPLVAAHNKNHWEYEWTLGGANWWGGSTRRVTILMPDSNPFPGDVDYSYAVPVSLVADHQCDTYNSAGNKESGHYISPGDNCYIETVYTNGFCHVKYDLDGGGTRWAYAWAGDFNIPKIDPPKNVWLGKNQNWYDIQDTIYLAPHADGADYYWFSVYKGEQHIIDQAIYSEYSFPANQWGYGDYSAYITAANSAGGTDSERIYFSVVGSPTYSNVRTAKETYEINDTVEISVDTICAKGQVIGIDKDGVGRVVTEECGSTFSISASQLGAGSYSAYFTVYNGSGGTDTTRIQFKINGYWPSKTTLGAYVGTNFAPTTFGWNATENTTHYALKIWKGTCWEGPSYKEFLVYDTSYVVDLPAGYYEAYVDSLNEYGWTCSDVIKFTIEYDNPYDSGDDFYANIAIVRDDKWEHLADVDGNVIVNNDGNNLWHFTKTSGGGYFIQNVATGKYLDVSNALDENGCNVQTYNYNGSAAQIWYRYGRWGEYLKPKCTANRIMDIDRASGNAQIWDLEYNDNQKLVIWIYDKFNISYDMNGGVGNISNQVKVDRYDTTISSIIPTRTGYDFVGWSKDKNAATAEYLSGAIFTENENTTLYAVWREAKLENISTLSAETIKLGETVTATAKATGGTGEYLYQVVYKQTTQSKWTTAQSYKANATVTFKPANAVTYDVCVKVKDSNNTEVKKFFTVKVTSDALKNVSTISAETINLGSTVTVNAKATGSTGFYTYAVYYKQKAQTKWTTKQDFKANNTIAVKPAKATTYDICVKVKDDKGTIVKKYFTVNVTDFKNTSTISATEIKLGNTVKVSCSATGSTGYYQYAVYYKKTSDTKWTTKQSYSSNNMVTIKPAKATTYDVCVKVKDNQNNEVKKYFKVTVQ